MPRRAQSSLSPSVLLVGLALIAAAALAGFFLLNRSSAPSHPPLNIDDFKKNSLSLRGNKYSLVGTVDRRDRVTANGQLITLFPGTEAKTNPIPVLLPAGLQGENIEPGYRLHVVVEINKDGIPEAQTILK